MSVYVVLGLRGWIFLKEKVVILDVLAVGIWKFGVDLECEVFRYVKVSGRMRWRWYVDDVTDALEFGCIFVV